MSTSPQRNLDPCALDALAPGLRQELIASINELDDYLVGEWGGSNGMIGSSAGVHERAMKLVAELEGRV